MMRCHEELELRRSADPSKTFVSDWNGVHHLVSDFLGPLRDVKLGEVGDVASYARMEADERLTEKVSRLHAVLDGVGYPAAGVLATPGSSAALATCCTWLRRRGVAMVHYFPPLYYNFGYLFETLGLVPIRTTTRHAFEDSFSPALPDERTVLVFTDPVWYAGRPLDRPVIDEIRVWQERTESLVLVDGTFQYMRWDGETSELASTLVPELTIRIVSPTKYLSIHGFRFAYVLFPEEFRDELVAVLVNVAGPGGLADVVFAHRAIDLMLTAERNTPMVDHARRTYDALLARQAIGEHVVPESGYFLFATVNAPPETLHAMDAECFELSGYSNHVRVNLLNPSAVEALSLPARG